MKHEQSSLRELFEETASKKKSDARPPSTGKNQWEAAVNTKGQKAVEKTMIIPEVDYLDE